MIPLTLPEPSKSQPRHFTWLSLTICVLGAALLVEKANKHFDLLSHLSNSQAAQPVTVSIGPAHLRLAEDLIIGGTARRASRSDLPSYTSLRLSLSWPELTAADRLLRTSDADLIVVDLDSNPGRESLRARIEPFFRRLARGGEIAGPDGLKILTLSARGEPVSDFVAYDPADPDGFIARCRKEPTRDEAHCHRARRLEAGLELRYRFDQSLLPNWRQLDQALDQRLAAWRI